MARKTTGMLPYTIEVTNDDDGVTAYAGLPLVVETMRATGRRRRSRFATSR